MDICRRLALKWYSLLHNLGVIIQLLAIKLQTMNTYFIHNIIQIQLLQISFYMLSCINYFSSTNTRTKVI